MTKTDKQRRFTRVSNLKKNRRQILFPHPHKSWKGNDVWGIDDGSMKWLYLSVEEIILMKSRHWKKKKNNQQKANFVVFLSRIETFTLKKDYNLSSCK